MPQMTLHFVNARQQLAGLEGWLSERLNDAFAASAELLPLQDTDVIVGAGKRVVPEKGHVGFAPETGVVYVTVDPEHPMLRANPGQSLERMLVHELHHSARWDGPGYGKTLGEALVSEGLAGHFAQEVFGAEPEPWEGLPTSALLPHVPKAQGEWGSTDYNHAEWFFGVSVLPRWLGYSLGYHLVGRYLGAHREARASRLAVADAKIFRAYMDAI